MRSFFWHWLACGLMVLAGVALADPGNEAAGDTTGTNRPTAKLPARSKARQTLAITPEREAAVLDFVERNHAELTDLLTHLKNNNPRQYAQAVKEIYRVTDRLAQLQERDPLHYELEVKLWTAQSRVQLLTARLRMGESDEYRQQLREAVAAQVEARLAVLKHQRDQAAQRLAKMDRAIQELEENREAVIDKQVAGLERAASGKASGKKPGKAANKRAGDRKPAAKKSAD